MKEDTFYETVDFLWRHRKFYYKFYDDYVIDYPDYACLPSRLYSTFSPEVVDALQNIWHHTFKDNDEVTTQRDFTLIFKHELKRLGEEIK